MSNPNIDQLNSHHPNGEKKDSFIFSLSRKVKNKVFIKVSGTIATASTLGALFYEATTELIPNLPIPEEIGIRAGATILATACAYKFIISPLAEGIDPSP